MKSKKKIKSKKTLRKIKMYLFLVPKKTKKEINTFSTKNEDFFFLKFKLGKNKVDIKLIRNKKYKFNTTLFLLNNKRSSLHEILNLRSLNG